MSIIIVQGNITHYKVDAIVNAANCVMRGGGGVDGAIHAAAGPDLLAECIEKYPYGCPVGQVRVTGGHNLPAKYIIHTVGPDMREYPESVGIELLRLAYRSCLWKAKEMGLKSIAFPAISTGVYGFDPYKAADIAMQAVDIHGEGLDVYFVCFDDETESIYEFFLAGDEPQWFPLGGSKFTYFLTTNDQEHIPYPERTQCWLVGLLLDNYLHLSDAFIKNAKEWMDAQGWEYEIKNEYNAYDIFINRNHDVRKLLRQFPEFVKNIEGDDNNWKNEIGVF